MITIVRLGYGFSDGIPFQITEAEIFDIYEPNELWRRTYPVTLESKMRLLDLLDKGFTNVSNSDEDAVYVIERKNKSMERGYRLPKYEP